MRHIELIYTTMLAELGQRDLDAHFHSAFPANGWFVAVPVKDREYWYFETPAVEGARKKRVYVGNKGDADMDARIVEFSYLKEDLRNRKKIVNTLLREGGMFAPSKFAGEVIETVAKAGLFRDNGVLLGPQAFQTYSGLLGIRIPPALAKASGAVPAREHSVSMAAGSGSIPFADILVDVDASFRETAHHGSENRRLFVNGDGFEVTIHKDGGTDDLLEEYLVTRPMRITVLHRSGIDVNVPAPARFALHGLMTAGRDPMADGSALRQAALLFSVLGEARRHFDVAMAFLDAWDHGRELREAMENGLSMMDSDVAESVRGLITEGLNEMGETPYRFPLFLDGAGKRTQTPGPSGSAR